MLMKRSSDISPAICSQISVGVIKSLSVRDLALIQCKKAFFDKIKKANDPGEHDEGQTTEKAVIDHKDNKKGTKPANQNGSNAKAGIDKIPNDYIVTD